MSKNVIAAVTAGVLALVGVVALVVWAQGANQRAFDGADLVDVVRVTAPVPADTPAEELTGSVEIAQLPASAVPDGAVTDLGEVAGLATTTTLQPGEVLLSARLAAPGESEGAGADVPEGSQEVTFSVEAQRSLAGALKPGDKLGLIASFEERDGNPAFTSLVSHDVLVTRVAAGSVGEESPTGGTSVTVAVSTRLAEEIVFSMEFGRVWLTLQNAGTARSGEQRIEVGDLR